MKVLCVGKNYAKHAAELASTVPDSPIWFWKPDSAVVPDGGTVRVPTDVGAVHHEVELAVRIGPGTPRNGGTPTVDAFTVAVDVTARDLQNEAKENGWPWDRAKGYDTFLPLGDWVPADGVELQDLRLRLAVDGHVRQDGTTADMVWSVEELLQHAAEWTTLVPGDVLLTGTPEGVGPIVPGQEMVTEVAGHAKGTWRIEGR